MEDIWEVHTKGGANLNFEICIIKKTNLHGHRSCGWFDKNKICIAQSCDVFVSPRIWDGLVRLAYEICDEMNAEHKKSSEIGELR